MLYYCGAAQTCLVSFLYGIIPSIVLYLTTLLPQCVPVVLSVYYVLQVNKYNLNSEHALNVLLYALVHIIFCHQLIAFNQLGDLGVELANSQRNQGVVLKK